MYEKSEIVTINFQNCTYDMTLNTCFKKVKENHIYMMGGGGYFCPYESVNILNDIISNCFFTAHEPLKLNDFERFNKNFLSIIETSRTISRI